MEKRKKRLIKFIGLTLFNLPFIVMYLAYEKIVYSLDVKSRVNAEIDDLKSKDTSDLIKYIDDTIDELDECIKWVTVRYSIPVYMILMVITIFINKRG